MQYIIVLVSILFMILLITLDKTSNQNDDKDYYINDTSTISFKEKTSPRPEIKVVNFDIYQLKGDRLNNIKRRSFREALVRSLNGSGKYKISYNPNIKIVVSFNEKIIKLKKRILDKRGRDFYRVEKKVIVTLKYALLRDSKKSYFLDKIDYRANINAGSYSNYNDALFKIDKRLYSIIGQKLSNNLLANYKTVIQRVRDSSY